MTRRFPPGEVVRMAKTKRWGDDLPTKLFPSYPCPDCGRMTRPSRAWVNQKGRWVCDMVCEDCPVTKDRCGIVCGNHWNLWSESPLFDNNPFYREAFSAKVTTLDDFM